jgi:hypothetical protein
MIKKCRGKRDATVQKSSKILTREDVLRILGTTIQSQAEKIRHGRIRDKEAFGQRIRAIRALGYTSNVYLAGLKDEDLTKVMKELEELEELVNAE